MTDRDTRGDEPTGSAGTSAEADESSEPATCALPGCDETLSELPGGMKRQYCSPAHRAAARQLSVQHAWQAGQDPGSGGAAADWTPRTARADEDRDDDAEAATAGWGDRDDWEEADGGHSRWLTGRRVVTVLAAVALAGGIVSAVMFTRGTQRPATRPAAAASPHTRAQAGPGQLLAKGSSWAGRAEHAFTAVTRQLSVLTGAEKSINAVPAAQRSRRVNALLPKIRRQVSKLGRERASLSRGLTDWGLYQRSTLELAGISGELNYLRKLAPREPQGHSTKAGGGSITSATRSLAANQKALTSQVGTLTADVRKTVAQPIAAIPAGNLVKQVLNVIPTAPVGSQASAPAPPSPAAGPVVTHPAISAPSPSPSPSPSKTRTSSVTAPPHPRAAAARSASPGRAESRAGQSHLVTPRPVASVIPRPSAGLAGRNAVLTAAEAAAGQAIQNESRSLGPRESRQTALLVRQILQWIRSEYYHR